jgi:hypothetical protein
MYGSPREIDEECLHFYGSRRFITEFIKNNYWVLFWGTMIVFTPRHSIPPKSILIPSSYLSLSPASSPFPRGFLPNILYVFIISLMQCCTTFLHSRHTKYRRRVMAAHQPHFAYCGGGEMVYGIDWPRQLLTNRPQLKNVLADVHNYPSLLLRHLF